MNNGHILNIDAIKNAIPIKYREGDETKVDRIIPQQFGATKDTDGNPVPVLFAYSVNQRGVCGYPIPGIVEFNGEVPEITESERKNRPKDPAMFARVACSIPQPGEFFYMMCVSLAKELHWANRKLEFFRTLGHSGYSTLEETFDDIWGENQDDDCPDAPMSEDEAWDRAIDKMMKEEK